MTNASDLEVCAKLARQYEREHYGDLSRLAAGQIWLVDNEVTYRDGRSVVLEPDPDRPNLVVLVAFREDFEENPWSVVQVRPISKQWIFTSPHDLFFSAEEGSLGVPFMVECWNPRPMLRSGLLKPVAQLDERAVEDIDYLNSCDLQGIDPNPAAIKSKGRIGSPIESKHDPRIKFQNEEFDKTDFLGEPMREQDTVSG